MELAAQGGGLEPPAGTFGAGDGSFEIAPVRSSRSAFI